MNERTPTPWLADPDNRPGYEWNVHVVEASNPDMRICFMSAGPNSEANAAFIVKAVNAHDDLVNALTEIADNPFCDPTGASEFARAALASIKDDHNA